MNVAVLGDDRRSVLFDNGKTFRCAYPAKEFDSDEAGFSYIYERGDGIEVCERHNPQGETLWWSYGPPLATIDADRSTVLLPSGKRVSFALLRVPEVRAFRDGFLVTTTDPARRDIPETRLSRRNVIYLGPDGEQRWRIGEYSLNPRSYDGTSVQTDGSLWALASTPMYMARIDPDTGSVLEIQPYK